MAQGLKSELCAKIFHPRVMSRSLLHSTLNTSTSVLSPTSPVLHSSTSPTPGLLSHASITHCKDPRQDGTSAEYQPLTGKFTDTLRVTGQKFRDTLGGHRSEIEGHTKFTGHVTNITGHNPNVTGHAPKIIGDRAKDTGHSPKLPVTRPK